MTRDLLDPTLVTIQATGCHDRFLALGILTVRETIKKVVKAANEILELVETRIDLLEANIDPIEFLRGLLRELGNFHVPHYTDGT